MKKLICFFTIFVFWGITDSMAQGLHFGVKAGVLGNKANIIGMRDQYKKLTNTSNRRSADIKTQSIDIPIELKWDMGISNNFDLFLGVGPSFSFLVDKDNWGRKLAHIAVDVIDKDLPSMGWRSTEVGLNLGGGVKIVNHLMVSCYYNIGLTQSAKHNIGGNKHDAIDQIFDGDVFESKNRYWQLSLAYVF